ncbi:MAG: D-aminoacyl-tRNA deacylase [Candidatus Methanodesulfokora washburnensis]|jgi:D-aminoacyl-tRNA deacylase
MQKIALAVSEEDKASVNIGRHVELLLSEKEERIKLVRTNELHIYLKSHKELAPWADAVIFLSRHSGSPGKPVITAHAPGNFANAEYGGEPGKLSIAFPYLMKLFLIEAEKNSAGSGYEVAMEPTHHGPSFDVPTAFVEIGSSEREWIDEKAGEIVAVSLLSALKKLDQSNFEVAVGLGGPHINHHFTEIQLRSKYAVGHILRNYDIDGASKSSVISAFERSVPPARTAILDWKSLRSDHKSKIIPILEEIGVSIVKTKDLV